MVVMSAAQRRSQVGFFCGIAVPTTLGLGSLTFFLLPGSVPTFITIVIGVAFVAGAYFSFLRYDFEVDHLDEVSEYDRPRNGAFRIATLLAISRRAGIPRTPALIVTAAAIAVLALGLSYGLWQILS